MSPLASFRRLPPGSGWAFHRIVSVVHVSSVIGHALATSLWPGMHHSITTLIHVCSGMAPAIAISLGAPQLAAIRH